MSNSLGTNLGMWDPQIPALAARYRVRDLPVTYVLDGHGNVAWVGGPEKTETDLIAAIEAARP